jgi:hypothetical protein
METATTFETSVGNQLPKGNGSFSVTTIVNGLIITPSNSSAISQINYLADDRVLVVTYSNGGMYHYKEVPATTVFHLLVAESFGKFINTHIKPNYEFRKIW